LCAFDITESFPLNTAVSFVLFQCRDVLQAANLFDSWTSIATENSYQAPAFYPCRSFQLSQTKTVRLVDISIHIAITRLEAWRDIVYGWEPSCSVYSAGTALRSRYEQNHYSSSDKTHVPRASSSAAATSRATSAAAAIAPAWSSLGIRQFYAVPRTHLEVANN
jgi:hypothetical protein